jgi:hypothetical protein
MRNLWYPKKKAEYMTTMRLQELGLTQKDIGERDPEFGTAFAVEESEPVAEPVFYKAATAHLPVSKNVYPAYPRP